ncbi:MAG: DUF4159 domain-containing protein [Planctomycetes bacterium]|nr:DUF4159 domain-containing protein [Planctomycetota bacterium]
MTRTMAAIVGIFAGTILTAGGIVNAGGEGISGQAPGGPAASPAGAVEFNAANIEKAVEKGRAWLLSRQQTDGSWPAKMRTGPTALAICALLASGVPAKDEKIQKALEWLKAADSLQAGNTYDKSLCCLAYRAANVQLQNKYRDQLAADVEVIVGDGSGSQYGLQGAWAGARAGVEVPRSYFEMCLKQCIVSQNSDGGWKSDSKDAGGCDPAATVNSLAGMFVIIDAIMSDKFIKCNMANEFAPIKKGMDWMDKIFTDSLADKSNEGFNYYLYGVARLGLASGRKHFGEVDWFKAGAKLLLNSQDKDGSWAHGKGNPDDGRPDGNTAALNEEIQKMIVQLGDNEFNVREAASEKLKNIGEPAKAALMKKMQEKDLDPEVSARIKAIFEKSFVLQAPESSYFDSTSYALLFLARGRQPVIVSRLEYDGDWNNRPRALANFCRWSETIFEAEVNWQVVSLKSDPREWLGSPILVITGSRAPKFSDADIEKLQTYIKGGGTIFSITECGGAAFSNGMRNFYKKIDPENELKDCGADHKLNTVQYKLPQGVKLYEIHDGARPLVIHTDVDLSLAWQTFSVATGKANFEIAANVLMYVTGKKFANRDANPKPAEPAK